MNILLLCTLILFGSPVYGYIDQERTESLHAEAKGNQNPNITQETHPTLYNLVKNLVSAAHIDMPRYITVYGAEGLRVSRHGQVHKTAHDITAWVDVCGDLHICHEILTNLSYEEIEGIIAVAIAEKASKKPGKLALVGCTTFAATIALIYYLNKKYSLNIWSSLFYNDYGYNSCRQRQEDKIDAFLFITTTPAALLTKLVSNNLQKSIDIEATRLTDTKRVINGIESLIKLEDTYFKEDIVSRIASALKLKKIYNVLFYPIRAFTPEERVRYLHSLS